MTRKTNRLKANAATIIFGNHLEVDAAIARIGMEQRAREAIATEMNAELAAVKERHESRALPHGAVITELRQGVQIWCEANRADLTRGNRKTFTFGAGEVSWRMRPRKVTVRSEGIVIGLLKKLGLERFIRTAESLDKNAILAEPNVESLIEGVSGLSISQGEDFVIKPFASEIEEVQP